MTGQQTHKEFGIQCPLCDDIIYSGINYFYHLFHYHKNELNKLSDNQLSNIGLVISTPELNYLVNEGDV